MHILGKPTRCPKCYHEVPMRYFILNYDLSECTCPVCESTFDRDVSDDDEYEEGEGGE